MVEGLAVLLAGAAQPPSQTPSGKAMGGLQEGGKESVAPGYSLWVGIPIVPLGSSAVFKLLSGWVGNEPAWATWVARLGMGNGGPWSPSCKNRVETGASAALVLCYHPVLGYSPAGSRPLGLLWVPPASCAGFIDHPLRRRRRENRAGSLSLSF